jgi:predicted RNase H-like HicB family nuclease
MTTPNVRTYNLFITLQRSDEMPGKWVAHCLDVDVVSYGESLKDAIDMIKEAVEMVFVEDFSSGREPLERRAPKVLWDEMWKNLLPHTVTLPMEDVLKKPDSEIRYAVFQPTLTLHLRPAAARRISKEPPPVPEFELPVVQIPCYA